MYPFFLLSNLSHHPEWDHLVLRPERTSTSPGSTSMRAWNGGDLCKFWGINKWDRRGGKKGGICQGRSETKKTMLWKLFSLPLKPLNLPRLRKFIVSFSRYQTSLPWIWPRDRNTEKKQASEWNKTGEYQVAEPDQSVLPIAPRPSPWGIISTSACSSGQVLKFIPLHVLCLSLQQMASGHDF